MAPVSTYQLLSGAHLWNMGRLACNQASGEVQNQLREKNPINKPETSVVYNTLGEKRNLKEDQHSRQALFKMMPVFHSPAPWSLLCP